MRRIQQAVLVVLALALTQATFATEIKKVESKDPGALKEQVERQKAEIEQLQKQVDDLKAEIKGKVPVMKAPVQCPADTHTFVRYSEGDSCETYQAQVAGWSDACVPICKPAARLREATASAAETCKNFCKERGCPASRYAAPSQCAVTRCLISKGCAQICPYFDACYLEQHEIRWNCWCDKVEG
jgi:uncharacterized protein YukE